MFLFYLLTFLFYFLLFYLQLPPRLIKLALVICILVAIFSQVDSAEGK